MLTELLAELLPAELTAKLLADLLADLLAELLAGVYFCLFEKNGSAGSADAELGLIFHFWAAAKPKPALNICEIARGLGFCSGCLASSGVFHQASEVAQLRAGPADQFILLPTTTFPRFPCSACGPFPSCPWPAAFCILSGRATDKLFSRYVCLSFSFCAQ